ncbi:MAG: oxygen-independent coproporphyrinogen III oxidase [Flavobacteriales bacterium]
MNSSLIKKYNVPGPRYTSYPTVPYWDEEHYNRGEWLRNFRYSFDRFGKEEGLSLYIHLPFCESLCTFCGCNKRITKDHSVEGKYIDSVLKEWQLYREQMSQKPVIADIMLGGGTPTFFSPDNLKKLIKGLLHSTSLTQKAAFSFEGHPMSTTKEHFQVLHDLGFRRVSFGIQDFDHEVQKVINRIQPFENVKEATETARNIGYDSVNYDIIYGLPLQKRESIIDTVEKVKDLAPDRLAFYSYAHVPWKEGVGQRKFSEKDLPEKDEKRELYELGKEMLENAGYKEIGMDHFALPCDELYKAEKNGRLHRNFMGYIPFTSKVLLGLGVSAISDCYYAYSQNVKKVEDYCNIVSNNEFPILKGHINDHEDMILRRIINDLMCNYKVEWSTAEQIQVPELARIEEMLAEPLNDGLIDLYDRGLSLTKKGRPFVRNICMAFDLKLWRDKPTTRIFSMTV